MSASPHPPAFLEAVRSYLAGAKDQFNYPQLLHTFIDHHRFERWAALVDRIHPVAGARFLSSGCGAGGSLTAYLEAGAARAVGVEVDDAFVQLAALRVADLPHAEALRYDGAQLPFDAASFDIVESMDVIEHTPDPSAYLGELLRVLAPGGVILLVTPNRLWPVEQHLEILGPPWLPVGVADAVFGAAAGLPWRDSDRSFRYRRLRGIRTQNLSLLRLRRLAVAHGLHLALLRPAQHPVDWPLPPEHPARDGLLDWRYGKFLAPVKTLAVTLQRR